MTHFTDLFEGHNCNRYKDSFTDDGTQNLPKHAGEVLSILFTFQCVYGWFDKLNLLAWYAVSTSKYLTTFQKFIALEMSIIYQLTTYKVPQSNFHPTACHEVIGGEGGGG